MGRALMYFAIGTLASFLGNYYFFGTGQWKLDLFYSAAFGLGWGLAYFVDHPEWPLAKKMMISFIGVAVILALGFLFFDFIIVIPSIIRFSTVFVAYYLIASFKESKSLRY